jgi:tRNA A-37 threonylcarbamoyl transferase component Bud32
MDAIDIALENELIGKYRAQRKLGEGASSEVFLCRDEFHSRDVAIKRVRASAMIDAVDGPVYARFFAAEASLVGRLQHPNVVQIFDAVADPLAPYVVMEYVPGTTLRPFCRPDSLLPLELIVEIGFKCAMALGYVFRQGLIHRDVKPANILAVTHDGTPTGDITDVKVSDFGSVLNLSSDVTQIDHVGSLAYMSPEQLDGHALDCRADIYSLGAVLYHLIAGRPPFDAPSQAVLMNHIYNQLPTPLTGMRAGVDEAVDAVIQRALAKNPSDRYPNWDEFAQALSSLIADHKVPRGHDPGRARLRALQPCCARLDFFARFRRRRAVGGGAPRQVAALFVRPLRSSSRGEEGRTFHIIAQGGVEVYPLRQARGRAGRGHVGRRDGLPGAQPRAAPAQHRRGGVRTDDDHLVHPGSHAAAEPGLPAPVRRGLHPRAGAPPARRARSPGPPAPHHVTSPPGRCQLRRHPPRHPISALAR